MLGDIAGTPLDMPQPELRLQAAGACREPAGSLLLQGVLFELLPAPLPRVRTADRTPAARTPDHLQTRQVQGRPGRPVLASAATCRRPTQDQLKKCLILLGRGGRSNPTEQGRLSLPRIGLGRGRFCELPQPARRSRRTPTMVLSSVPAMPWPKLIASTALTGGRPRRARPATVQTPCRLSPRWSL